MSDETGRLTGRLLDCLNETDDLKNQLRVWTDSIEELSETIEAFKVMGKTKLRGKTILDVGTDCVKAFYIALKFVPKKIIGICEDLSQYPFESVIRRRSNLLSKTKISFYSCNLFDEESLNEILESEQVKKFDYVLLSKTLHHLRIGEECVADRRDREHQCQDDHKCCIYQFKTEVFDRLLGLGDRVVVYEPYFPDEEDEDKVRGRGGYFTENEWSEIFRELPEEYKGEFVRPVRCSIDVEGFEIVKATIRLNDYVCFYLEKENLKAIV